MKHIEAIILFLCVLFVSCSHVPNIDSVKFWSECYMATGLDDPPIIYTINEVNAMSDKDLLEFSKGEIRCIQRCRVCPVIWSSHCRFDGDYWELYRMGLCVKDSDSMDLELMEKLKEKLRQRIYEE